LSGLIPGRHPLILSDSYAVLQVEMNKILTMELGLERKGLVMDRHAYAEAMAALLVLLSLLFTSAEEVVYSSFFSDSSASFLLVPQ
jgi:hypothetical protein